MLQPSRLTLALPAAVLLLAGCSTDAPLAPTPSLDTPALAAAPFETSATAVALAIGDTHQVSLTQLGSGRDLPIASLRWSSSNELVATVSSSGLVSAVGAGEAVVSVTRGIHVASVAVRVTSCRVTPLDVGTTTGAITPFDCYFEPAGRYSDYFSVSSPNGQVMRLVATGIVGVTGVKAATTDLAAGTVYGSRLVGAPFRLIGNGDPLQFFLSGMNATTFGSYSVTRSVDTETHTCSMRTYVMPGATFAADLQVSNACRYNIAFTEFPPALGKPLLAHRYWVRVEELKPYTITVGGLSASFDPAVVVFPNIVGAAPVAYAAGNGQVPAPTRSATFTPTALGYYLIEISTGRFSGGIADENWVNDTGPFTVSVSR